MLLEYLVSSRELQRQQKVLIIQMKWISYYMQISKKKE